MTDLTRPEHDPAAETSVTPNAAAEPAAPLEPTPGPIATAPVAPPPATTPRPRNRTRWIAAIGVIAAVTLATGAVAYLLTGASPAATVVGYVPSDSVAYGEVRLDLPGDQEQAIGEFLSKFPGFADQAALDTKLDEVLDRLISDATEGAQTFTADIKPWFDGEMAFAVGPLPDMAAVDDPAAAAAAGRALILLSIKDEALARAWFADAMAESGTTGTTETYGGVEMTVFTDADMPGATAAFAIVGGKVALAGDITSVKAAIDTNGSGGLAGDPDFKAASEAMDGDHIGFMYVDTGTLVESALEMTESLASAPPVSSSMLALVPDWMSFRLRVESDALVMDGASPHVDGAPGPDANATNDVAAWAPPATVLMAAGTDAGATVLEAVELYRSDPTLGEIITGIEGGAGMFGGLDAALGWMGDTGLVVAADGSVLEGGLVSIPTDAAAARQTLTTIRSLVTLAGASAGIQIREEDYAGTTITIIDLGSAEDLAGMAGALGGGALPTDPGTAPLPEGNVELALAATDGVVVIGSGPDFVKSVLDAGAGTSLADDARYQSLLSRVGSENTGVTFVDIAAVRGVLEGLLSEATAEDRAEYEESIKPFLTPFDAFIAAGTVGAELDGQHAVITVK